MNIQELTRHPEMMNRETLYELRRLTASYPYYQPARLLLLKNLYLLHDSSFDEELRRAAIYFSDRRILFNLVEAAHYRLKRKSPQTFPAHKQTQDSTIKESRTVSLIDSFLNSIPEDSNKDEKEQKRTHRKPTAADATIDYVAYLSSTDFEELNDVEGNIDSDALSTPTDMNGSELIDAFIQNDGGRFTLQDNPVIQPEVQIEDNSEINPEEEFLTETLAGIYIKQGRYEKALDIMKKINNDDKGKKNIYFEDQQRFLKKLIKNHNNNK